MELMLLEIDATGTPATSKPDADHHAVIGVDVLVRVSLKINVFKDLSEVLQTGLATSMRPRPHRIIRSVPPDGVLVGQLDQCVEVAAIDSFKAQTYKLHVLLRNNRSPRLQRWFERNALTESFELSH